MLTDNPIVPMLAVSDLGRARKFYEDVLGFKATQEHEEDITYESGGVKFGIYPSQFAGTNQSTAAGFLVTDLLAEKKDLESKGVTFEDYDLPGVKTDEGVATIGLERAAWFRDPDGNILALFQAK